MAGIAPAWCYKFGCVWSVSFRPTETGLCEFGWVWSSLNRETHTYTQSSTARWKVLYWVDGGEKGSGWRLPQWRGSSPERTWIELMLADWGALLGGEDRQRLKFQRGTHTQGSDSNLQMAKHHTHTHTSNLMRTVLLLCQSTMGDKHMTYPTFISDQFV